MNFPDQVQDEATLSSSGRNPSYKQQAEGMQGCSPCLLPLTETSGINVHEQAAAKSHQWTAPSMCAAVWLLYVSFSVEKQGCSTIHGNIVPRCTSARSLSAALCCLLSGHFDTATTPALKTQTWVHVLLSKLISWFCATFYIFTVLMIRL